MYFIITQYPICIQKCECDTKNDKIKYVLNHTFMMFQFLFKKRYEKINNDMSFKHVYKQSGIKIIFIYVSGILYFIYYILSL